MDDQDQEIVQGSVQDIYGHFMGDQYQRLLTHIVSDKNFNEMPPSLQAQWAASVVAMVLFRQLKAGVVEGKKIETVIDVIGDEIKSCLAFMLEDDRVKTH